MRATRSRPPFADRGPAGGPPVAGPSVRPRAAAPGRPRRAGGPLSAVATLATLTLFATAPVASAAPPAPCGGVPQITDARGDGHHPNADVTAAWFSEAQGRLQAVIQTDVASWNPAHEDSASAGAALLWRSGGVVRYVRIQTFPAPGTPTYDFGTWTRAGGFAPQGTTTGTTTSDVGGSATIDVPAATGATAGTTLAGPFVLTYDGASGGDLHWVDRAPGGVSPDTTETGADYVVGACGAPAPGAPLPGTPTVPGSPTATASPTTAVAITARRLLVGGGTVKVTGRATPGRAGVPVAVVTTARGRSRTVRTTTRATGAWAVRVPVTETSTVKATVEGVGSQTATVTVRSTARITRVLRRGRRVVVTGRVSPRLPGRVLLLRTDAVRPTRTVRARGGRFTVVVTSPKRGRYQVVFVPTGERAERSTSNTKSIR